MNPQEEIRQLRCQNPTESMTEMKAMKVGETVYASDKYSPITVRQHINAIRTLLGYEYVTKALDGRLTITRLK